jgi:ribosomal protein S18 acetylase RimI-like enzyme
MIRYLNEVDGIRPDQLEGFFEGWPSPPTPETHLTIMRGSYRVVLALDDDSDVVVGFISAVSDAALAAYIPLLEVLPAYRRRGIGRELVTRMQQELGDLYMVDLVCDEALEPFYASLGMKPAHRPAIRNHTGERLDHSVPAGGG